MVNTLEAIDESDLNGIKIKSTTKGFVIELDGLLYKEINDNINNGKFTKEFYHELKQFVKNIKSFQ